MATFIVRFTKKGLTEAAVRRCLTHGLDGMGITVTKEKKPPTSRADRFSEAIGQIEDAKGEVEALKDELQDWFDNLPENFQQGDKGQELEEAISNLDTVINGLEEATDTDVSFPGMY